VKTRRTVIAFLISLPFLSIGTLPAISANDETPRVLVNCKTAEAIPCIESFQVKTQNGEILNAKLTERKSPQESDFLGTGYEEYSLDGINFEGSSKNLLIPRVVYYPFGPNKSRDFLAIAVMPSWLNRDTDSNESIVEMPNRPTSLVCGSANNRIKCQRSNNFNSNISFVFTLRISSDFQPVWASGSTKDVSINWSKTVDSKSDWYRLPVSLGTLDREMVMLTDFYSDPIDAIESSQYADYPADWPNLWINSARDTSVNLLKECRQIPFMSVTTNAIYQDVPKWNPATESIDLKLWASHFKRDGSLNRGFYELKISDTLAKCFWGIDVTTNTKARVIISYPGSNEEAIVETVVTAFKNGIFQVQATNFTFSSPTIKAKILQQTSSIEPTSAAVIVKSTPTASPIEKTTGISKKLTLTCVKGKLTKKVTAVKPVCPTGYKKR
jgi:hypothetical protein